MIFGAANHDERRYADPSRFDITRDARDHMAFGHGAHACAGTGLARIEMEALLDVLVERVSRITARDARVSNNDTLFGFDRMTVELFT